MVTATVLALTTIPLNISTPTCPETSPSHMIQRGSKGTMSTSHALIIIITGSTVVLTCCKGDGQSQWKTPIFGPSQLGNPLTDFNKI